jgi:hypothetical protein
VANSLQSGGVVKINKPTVEGGASYETPSHWMVMGLNPNLEEAMKIAVRETILFLTERFPNYRAKRPI